MGGKDDGEGRDRETIGRVTARFLTLPEPVETTLGVEAEIRGRVAQWRARLSACTGKRMASGAGEDFAACLEEGEGVRARMWVGRVEVGTDEVRRGIVSVRVWDS